MIRYALICDHGHGFESWFPGSASFDAQKQRGLIACPLCGSAKVDRAVMAPNVARTDREASPAPADMPVAAVPVPAAPMALMGEKELAFRQMVSALHDHLRTNAEHVGPRFAEEALKIHQGESDARAIYGEATPGDARMLQEEGVDFLPLPRLPGSGN